MLIEEQKRALEKMGASMVKLQFSKRSRFDLEGTDVFLMNDLGCEKALLQDVIEWLAEKERDEKNLDEARFKTQLYWNIATFFVALIGTITAIVQLSK